MAALPVRLIDFEMFLNDLVGGWSVSLISPKIAAAGSH